MPPTKSRHPEYQSYFSYNQRASVFIAFPAIFGKKYQKQYLNTNKTLKNYQIKGGINYG